MATKQCLIPLAVADVLADETKTSEQKRAELRRLVYPTLKARPNGVKVAVKQADLSCKPTPSGLRDALPMKALILLAAGCVSVDELLEAVARKRSLDRIYIYDDDMNPSAVTEMTARAWVDTQADRYADQKNSTATTATNEATEATAPMSTAAAAEEITTKPVPSTQAAAINGVLSLAGLPPIESWQKTLKEAQDEIEKLRKEAASRPAMPSTGTSPSNDEIPAGTWSMKPAHEALSDLADAKAVLKEIGELPVFEWDHPHPMVPELDPHYVFRPEVLLPLLFAMQGNKRAWLHGHSGTGKSSAVHQLAARLKMPCITVSLDSDVSRMDLMGRDVLITDDDGNTRSEFKDGVLPKWFAQPCVILLDELDYGRSDVMYVLQRALEHGNLVVEEDGNRVVRPHPLNRIFATGNTKGCGDESGLYPGARTQSAAFLNRFVTWISVGYMEAEKEIALLSEKFPRIPSEVRASLQGYIEAHRQAFVQAEILQPLSQRNLTAFCEAFSFAARTLPTKKAADHALDWTILGGASEQDATVMRGIADRVFTF